MTQRSLKGWIGVFDSGVGGISVLKALVAELPHENFYFFGDSANAPYGEKTDEEVYRLSSRIVENFLERGCKAIIIACNTASAVAAAPLRHRFPDVPIIAVEPALKPATLAPKHDRILVMATPVTLRLVKYHKLAQRWGSRSHVISLPCPGLAGRIEKGNLDAPDLKALVEKLVGSYAGTVDSVVLGCTHYPFIKGTIREVVGDVPFFDGGKGTARELKRKLAQHGLLSFSSGPGQVVFDSSIKTDQELKLYGWFFRQEV